MTLQVLISAMHQDNHSLLERLGLECDAMVVNQCDNESVEQFQYNGHNIIWINSCERGLSRSRNMALAHATADIVLLADDDEELNPGYATTILSAFERHPDAGIIGFQANGIEEPFKTYSGNEGKVGYIRSMRMASVEIALKRQTLIEHDVKFNEEIGAGTKYKMGEENALLFNSLANGIKIYYVPQLICRVHIGNSTWFNGFDADYFHARGAVFTAMSKKWSIPLILQFAIRKRSLYRGSVGIIKACRLMLDGRKNYLHTR